MNEEGIFQTYRMWRSWNVAGAKQYDVSTIDIVPKGFNNNIRWNLGHVLAGWDHAIYTCLESDRKLPLDYHLMFQRGSKPADWDKEPPAFEEIIEKLESQTEEIIDACRGKLDQPLTQDFLGMKTLGEMFLFQIAHETLHMGTLGTLIKVVELEKAKTK